MPVITCAPICTNWCTPREAAEDRPVADVHVAGELRVVGEDRVVADLAVVRDVHVGHDPVVVADARDAGVLRRAAVERAELADGVAVADLEPRGLALVLLVLGGLADRAEMEDAVVAADARVARRSPRARRSRCPRRSPRAADDRVRADLDVRARAARRGSTIAVGWIIAARRVRRLARAHRSSASATTASSTRATPVNLPDAAQRALERHLELELVAGHHRLLEARAVDADEVVDRLAVVLVPVRLERQDRRGLRHRLDDQHARHHRVVREMPLEERLVRSSRS